MNIAIVGGGFTGLAAAYSLSKAGHEVTVFEKSNDTGGLASSFSINGHYLEKYYHHFFSSDATLIGLSRELGIDGLIEFTETKMGVFYEGRIHGFSTPLDILRFGPFGLVDKMRFSISMLRMKRISDWKSIEGMNVREWTVKNAGEKSYDVIWRPLLRSKFGERMDDTSAAWLWGRIKSRADSRGPAMLKERLGYFRGGFKVLLDTLESHIERRGGKIVKGCAVRRITVKSGKATSLQTEDGTFKFDKIISTLPFPSLLEVAPGLPREYTSTIRKIPYQGVVCMVLETRGKTGGYYWLNICDYGIPFGVCVEHTNFIGKERYGGSGVIYLTSYADPSGGLYRMSDEDLRKAFLKGFGTIFPQFSENNVKRCFIFRDPYATPVYTTNYSSTMPSIKTPVKGLFVANTSQIYPEDRNVNSSIKLGIRAASVAAFGQKPGIDR